MTKLSIEHSAAPALAHISQHRFVALDSWRGICALFVAVHHLQVYSDLYFLQIVRNSYLFVDFFFVLSGFVICYAYGEKLDAPSERPIFLIRRFGRLWPLHATMLLVFVCFELGILVLQPHFGHAYPRAPFTGPTASETLLPQILLVHGMGFLDGGSWNGPSWTISAELWVYVVFTIVFMLKGLSRALAITTLMATAFLILLFLAPNYLANIRPYGFARCVFGFFLGVTTWHIYTGGWLMLSRKQLATFLEILVIAVTGTYLCFVHLGPALMFAPFLFASVIFIFAHQQGALSHLLCTAPFVLLGTISYSIYMVHFAYVFLTNNGLRVLESLFHVKLHTVPLAGKEIRLGLISNAWVMDAYTIAYLGVVVGTAMLTYRIIEVPGRNFFNVLARRYAAN